MPIFYKYIVVASIHDWFAVPSLPDMSCPSETAAILLIPVIAFAWSYGYEIYGRGLHSPAIYTNMLTSGDFMIVRHGKDQYRNPVASGTYLISVSSRTESNTRKVILVR